MLLATGDIAVYYLDKTAATATWSKTLTNAELLTAAQAPYAMTDAVIEAFEVTPDGGSAFLAYKANEGATATGPCTLAMVKHTAPTWRYYATGETGNPGTAPDSFACITDGKWVLRCTLSSSAIRVGLGDSNVLNQRAWDNADFHEYLDMSIGYATSSSGTKYNITGNGNWSFCTNILGQSPRVIIYSPNKSDGWAQSLKGIEAEEVVLSTTAITGVGSWFGLANINKRVVLNLPNMTTADRFSFYQNGGKPDAEESYWADFNLSKLASIREGAFKNFHCKGVLELPSAVSISNQAFHLCYYMTEARVAAEKKTLKYLYSQAFAGSSTTANNHLKRVVLGGAPGFTFKATNVFLYQPRNLLAGQGDQDTDVRRAARQCGLGRDPHRHLESDAPHGGGAEGVPSRESVEAHPVRRGEEGRVPHGL